MKFAVPSDDRQGYTLVELLVVVSLIGLFAALAASDLSSLMGRFRMNSAARQFEKQVEACRVAAISENRECAIRLLTFDASPYTGTDWAGSYEVLRGDHWGSSQSWERAARGLVDLTTGPHERRGISIEQWQEIEGPPHYNLPNAVVFSPRGYVVNEPSDFQGGVIRVVFRNKHSPVSEGRVVRIDRGGNARIAAVE